MKPTAYIETTIIGYLTSRLSRDLITAAHQLFTQVWWKNSRQEFDIYVSELVVQEAGAGDPGEGQKRLEVLQDIPQLELNEDCRHLVLHFIITVTYIVLDIKNIFIYTMAYSLFAKVRKICQDKVRMPSC